MKKILLTVMICASAIAMAQKKVTAHTNYQYSDAVTLDFIDSTAYNYASFHGSITSNEPVFALEDEGIIVAWFFSEPVINYTSADY
ncbi:MAG: hypothetical protein R3277_11560 [Brumimicrobium sp.]|nr:hypothetical protein [Brumimicrobium sp.]